MNMPAFTRPASTQTIVPDHEVIIIGAGISGIGVAIQLRADGIDDILILERSEDVGGTWRDNRYPGIAVDITSFTYSFSFEQNANWSRVFAPGNELHHYTRRVASKYGIYPLIRFGVEVTRARFDDANHLWVIELDDGRQLRARHIISAGGGLISPKMPDISGLERFEGEVIHTARWPDSLDLTGKRVAVIGTGATAVQLIPEIAGKAKQLDVYQRTPIWVLKKPDRVLPSWLKTLFRFAPGLQRSLRGATDAASETLMVLSAIYYRQAPWLVRMCEKAGINNLREQLPDHPELWDKLTPKYGFGCKRPTFSNEYFRTFAREDVELVTTPIQHITARGITTSDGRSRRIDTLILATGYKTFEKGNIPSFEVIGTNGVDLGQFWHDHRYQAYEGLTVPGYPNFYIMLGPYALIGTSYFKMVEGNAIHLSRCIREANKRGATRVEIRQSEHDAYFRDIQKRQQNTVFLNHNCALSNSYYFDHHGDAPMLRPSTSMEMLWRAKHLPMDHYRFSRYPDPPDIPDLARIKAHARLVPGTS
ncbi:monooxygenase [Isoalcanivorax pacificus W11-5]|jgi:cation diffusion facilitator CzcD-associated flavoprotein CzcO|uniref:Monooxygenase n=1 Tax=Isoalcanivorax pacificus W11-5 TaxID=391936 RepID=A0A0B4XK50_9GAMM|nr:NAD(P)/FAD-dependent oxidoreductase [Isoalcanivorax pacificus]AJD48659.1 monooxygenase [Isoalcanivorax pacificus W11-5]